MGVEDLLAKITGGDLLLAPNAVFCEVDFESLPLLLVSF